MRFKLGYQNNSVRKLRYKTQLEIFFIFFGITSVWLIYNKIQINKLTKNPNKEILNHFQTLIRHHYSS